MPSGLAKAAREGVAKENRDCLQLERTPGGRTGFVNVVVVKGKYQARLQVPGDGRGGSMKRKQHALPYVRSTPRPKRSTDDHQRLHPRIASSSLRSSRVSRVAVYS